MPSSVQPLLSCNSSMPSRSGDARLADDLLRFAEEAGASDIPIGRAVADVAVVRVEVLDVVRRDAQPIRTGCHRAGGARERTAVEVRQVCREDAEVAEVVGHRADDERRGVADIDLRIRRSEQAYVDLYALRIEVDDATALDQREAATHVGAARVAAVVSDQPDLAEPVRRSDYACIVDLDQHAFQALVEIDAVLRRVVRSLSGNLDRSRRVVVDDRVRRDAPARADHDRRHRRVGEQTRGRNDVGRSDLSHREIASARARGAIGCGERRAGSNFADRAADLDLLSGAHAGRTGREHEDAVRRCRIAVAVTVLHVEAVAHDLRDDARHVGHALRVIGRNMAAALDRVDAHAIVGTGLFGPAAVVRIGCLRTAEVRRIVVGVLDTRVRVAGAVRGRSDNAGAFAAGTQRRSHAVLLRVGGVKQLDTGEIARSEIGESGAVALVARHRAGIAAGGVVREEVVLSGCERHAADRSLGWTPYPATRWRTLGAASR